MKLALVLGYLFLFMIYIYIYIYIFVLFSILWMPALLSSLRQLGHYDNFIIAVSFFDQTRRFDDWS